MRSWNGYFNAREVFLFVIGRAAIFQKKHFVGYPYISPVLRCIISSTSSHLRHGITFLHVKLHGCILQAHTALSTDSFAPLLQCDENHNGYEIYICQSEYHVVTLQQMTYIFWPNPV